MFSAPPELRAEAYDLFFGDRAEETAYWADQAAPFGRELYEPMIGTGEVAAGLAARGFHVRGVDIAPAMLAVARRRCPTLELHEADALAPPPFAGPVDLVCVPAGSFHHLVDDDDLAAFFASIHGVLRPGGGLGICLWAPPAQAEPWEERFDHGPMRPAPPGWTLRKITTRRWEPAHGMLTVHERLFAETPAGSFEDAYGYRLRMWKRDEAEAMLAVAGFEVATVHGSYAGEPWSPESDWCLITSHLCPS